MGNYIKSVHREFCGCVKKSEEVKPPIYYCYSCSCFCNNRCNFFNRPVIKDYNKCFHHTFYHPISAVFKTPDNLEEIIKAEEEKIA